MSRLSRLAVPAVLLLSCAAVGSSGLVYPAIGIYTPARTAVGILRLRGGHEQSEAARAGGAEVDRVSSLEDEDNGVAGWMEQPCIGAVQGFDFLEGLYREGNENEVFRSKIQELKRRYSGIRRVKGDGNCFIRAYAYAILESLIGKASVEASDFRGKLMGYFFVITQEGGGGLGYQKEAIEDFFQDIDRIVVLIEEGVMTVAMLEESFNNLSLSNSLIFFMRLIASCYFQQNPDKFAPFLGFSDEDPANPIAKQMKDYCLREVEPLQREVEQEQVMALTEALGWGVTVEYLDRSPGEINHHSFLPDAKMQATLLYRPGHYDLLCR